MHRTLRRHCAERRLERRGVGARRRELARERRRALDAQRAAARLAEAKLAECAATPAQRTAPRLAELAEGAHAPAQRPTPRLAEAVLAVLTATPGMLPDQGERGRRRVDRPAVEVDGDIPRSLIRVHLVGLDQRRRNCVLLQGGLQCPWHVVPRDSRCPWGRPVGPPCRCNTSMRHCTLPFLYTLHGSIDLLLKCDAGDRDSPLM